jgi:hypothetical protein
LAISGLAAVEEAGGEKDDGHNESYAGVQDVVKAQADKAVGEPGREAEKPDPCCLSHHRHAPEMGCSEVERAKSNGVVLHY